VRLAFLVVAGLLAAGCRGGEAGGSLMEQAREGIMGTRISVKVWVGPGARKEREAREGIERAFERAVEVQERMSPRDPASAVSRINASAGREAVVVDPWTYEVIERSVEVSGTTRGAFDPTWAALEDLWDHRSPDPAPPTPEQVEQRLGLVGARGILMDPEARTVKLKRKGMRIGLGGSAKGFALDRMAEALHGSGTADFICYAGGDLFVSGRRGDRSWRLGIQHPRDRGRLLARYSVDRSMAVVTSGDYERFFIHRGVRYHHILDPRTGFPASGTMSVTVLATSGLLADALSTGLFVLGAGEGLEVVEKLEGVEAVFVTAEQRVVCSSGICGALEMLSDDHILEEAAQP
jgi:thiamine biosynthesis lipoprotein